MESRTQGSRPRPRPGTQKKSKAKDRHRRGQGEGHKRKCSPKKKVFTKIFQAISTKKRFPKNFSGAPQNFYNSIFEDLRPRGQGLDLRGQGQGLQNVSSRPRTSSRTPPLIAISGPVIRLSATETVDSGSTPDQVKPKTIKIGIHNVPA